MAGGGGGLEADVDEAAALLEGLGSYGFSGPLLVSVTNDEEECCGV